MDPASEAKPDHDRVSIRPWLDPETPPSVLRRFAITTVDEDVEAATVMAAMPAGDLRNPFTGEPSVAALAILVDEAGGRANQHRRGASMWTVSSELTLELSPGTVDSLLDAPQEPVVASASAVIRGGMVMIN